MNSWAAASRLVRPWLTARATCNSWGGEPVYGLPLIAFAHGLAGRPQLVPGSLGPAGGAEPFKRVGREVQVPARVDPAAVPAQVLAVQQGRPGLLHRPVGGGVQPQALLEQRVRLVRARQQGPGTGRQRASLPGTHRL